MGTWALPKKDTELKESKEVIKDLKALKKRVYYFLGDDELFNNIDGAIKRINELIKEA